MNVAEAIMADIALNPPACHFKRLPLELRKNIYAMLLLPAPAPRTHCSVGRYTKQCSPGGRFLASTCKPKATVIRTVGCGTCEWRGGDVHTAVLFTDRAIYGEATDVLYENSQALFLSDGPIMLNSMGSIKKKIRHFVFAVSDQDQGSFLHNLHSIVGHYPNVKVIELHFDVDLYHSREVPVKASIFAELIGWAAAMKVEMVVDVHVICAWDDDEGWDGVGWSEPVTRREKLSEARAAQLDQQAHRMRTKFIEELRELYENEGATLVVKEN